MTQNPRRKDGVLLRSMDDECLLYDEQRGSVHVVNQVAGFVWEMCDGTNSLHDIETRARERYDVPPGVDVARDLNNFAVGLAELELISFPEDRSST